ncbi:MAG: SHOCT domain-containing protein [Clostridiales bacterium]|nr:SHOCT domain-containing protein [Clostridiales bacterium]
MDYAKHYKTAKTLYGVFMVILYFLVVASYLTGAIIAISTTLTYALYIGMGVAFIFFVMACTVSVFGKLIVTNAYEIMKIRNEILNSENSMPEKIEAITIGKIENDQDLDKLKELYLNGMITDKEFKEKLSEYITSN